MFCLPSGILLLISVMLHRELYQCHYCTKCTKSINTDQAPKTCCGYGCGCCFFYSFRSIFLFFKLLLPPVLWIVILFLDGNYYTCAEIMKDEKVTNKTCAEFNCKREIRNFLSGQQYHCDISRFIGGILIFLFLAILLFVYSFQYCTCCDMKDYYYKNECDFMREQKKKMLIMEALGNKADEEAKADFNNMSKQLCSFLSSVSETRPSNNGAETTIETSIHEKDKLLSGEEGTQQQMSSQEITHKAQIPLSVNVMIHQQPAVSEEETKV
ncbi:uncharacterized protein LOC144489827 isoform X2 [Mustelus asterias]